MDVQDTHEPVAEPPRVRFGSLPNQTVPLAWAEAMLMELADTKPHVLGALLQNAARLGKPRRAER